MASTTKLVSEPSSKIGNGQTEATLAFQKELVDSYEQANDALLARMKSEVELWSQLSKKLMATRSAPEAIQAYQECWAERMRMAAADGQKMCEDTQKFAQKMARSLSPR